MNLISFLILLIFYNAVSLSAFNQDEYFQNSIIRRIRDEKLSFESYINYVNDKHMESLTKEKHSFKYNRGESIMVERLKEDRKKDYDHIHRLLYFNDLQNVYIMDSDSKGKKKCNHVQLNEQIIDFYTKKWLPNDAFELVDVKSNNLVLSKSILLFSLIDYYDKKEANIKCEDLLEETGKKNTKICELIFKDKLKIEFKFEDKDEYTMYPFELSTYEKNDDNKWQLHIKYNYREFIVKSFDDDFTLDLRLPPGYGCDRIDSIDKYPKMKTIYGNKFNIEFDIDFEYQFNEMRNMKYSIKMFVDKDNQLMIADGLNELTNEPMTTYYNISKNSLYEISVKKDYCFSFNLNSETELNWYYIQDLLVIHPEFFNINNDYTYIGDYNCDLKGILPCTIYEKIFEDFNKIGDDKNEIYHGFLRKKKNGVKSDNVIITHYYSKEKDFRNGDNFRIPLKIVIRLRDYDEIETNKITINITSFTLNPDDRKFVTKCIRNDELDDERKKLEKEKLELKLEREKLEEEKAEFEKEKNSNIIEEYEIEIGELNLEKNYTIIKNN